MGRAPIDDKSLVVGVDIDGTKIALMATDIESGVDLAHDRFPTPEDAGPARTIEQLCTAITRLVDAVERPRESLRAVGVAVPGQVDKDRHRVIRDGNLSGWADVPLADIMTRQLSVPLFVEQDANAAALGERWRGSAKEINNFVFLALGTGVGAGLVINGRLYRGIHHAAGEVGNFVMGREYLGRDRKGNGNLESLIAGPTIRSHARRVAGKNLDAADLFKRADAEARLSKVADRVADYVAIPVVNIAALLDPKAIIFGGGTSAAGEALMDRVRERVERKTRFRPVLMRSVLGEDAQLHGAVFGALWRLDPELALREELR
jgi:glucokinase